MVIRVPFDLEPVSAMLFASFICKCFARSILSQILRPLTQRKDSKRVPLKLTLFLEYKELLSVVPAIQGLGAGICGDLAVQLRFMHPEPLEA